MIARTRRGTGCRRCWALFAAVLALIVVSLLTPKPAAEQPAKFAD